MDVVDVRLFSAIWLSIIFLIMLDRRVFVDSASLELRSLDEPEEVKDGDPPNRPIINTQQTKSKTTAYLRKYGYVDSKKNAGNLISLKHWAEAISNFQKMAGLKITGVADDETMQMMDLPRCGNSDGARNKSATNRARAGMLRSSSIRKKRYVLEGGRHRSRQLSYKITNYPSLFNRSRALVDAQIQRAFDIWSEQAEINFTRTDGKADFNINFYRGKHPNCEDVFDGPGLELGHASGPDDESDVHFDDQEHWAIDKEETDIFSVAVHEFGHALGISHSANNQSLMAPFYRYVPDLKLHSDDISAIQELYGARKRNSPRADLPIDLCQDSNIDAITQTQDGSTYVFKEKFYWLLADDGFVAGYPHLIGSDWNGLPNSLDAALTLADGNTFFFKGDQCWRFVNMQPEQGYPRLINQEFEGVPSDIDAAFAWSQDQRVYFFKGESYWRFEPDAKLKVGRQYPRPINQVWKGVPSDLSDALTWQNNQTYFFKGSQYYRFSDQDDEIDTKAKPAFPRSSSYWWFGCGASKSNR